MKGVRKREREREREREGARKVGRKTYRIASQSENCVMSFKSYWRNVRRAFFFFLGCSFFTASPLPTLPRNDMPVAWRWERKGRRKICSGDEYWELNLIVGR